LAGGAAAVGAAAVALAALDTAVPLTVFDDEAASYEERYSSGTIIRTPTIRMNQSRMNAGTFCHMAKPFQSDAAT
jgi:hypothetical protein